VGNCYYKSNSLPPYENAVSDSTRSYALALPSQGLPSPAPPLPPYRRHNKSKWYLDKCWLLANNRVYWTAWSTGYSSFWCCFLMMLFYVNPYQLKLKFMLLYELFGSFLNLTKEEFGLCSDFFL